MSSGGLSAHFPPGTPIPLDYLYLLSQITLAAGCVNYFIFAFLLFHTRIYLKEGWKNDTWFFRSLVSQLLVLSIVSIGLQSVGDHYVLQSLLNQEYRRRTLDWIDVVQRLLCFPTGCLTSLFFSWRIFQVSDCRAVWITCGLLWIPGTAAFMAAEITHVLTITNDFSYRRTWRICEVIGTVSLLAADLFFAAVLCYRLYIRRRKEAKPDVDPVSQYFLGTVQTSLLTCAVNLGGLVTISFLHSPRIYIISSFFLLILPSTWSLSVVWSINQRVTIRRKMASTADDASLGKRLAVVGWRNRIGGGIESQEEAGRDSRNDPSRWRGDEFSSVAHDDRSSHRHTFKFHKTLEPDYHSFDLDTGALDALKPSTHVRETQVSGIWVITETKIETSTIT